MDLLAFVVTLIVFLGGSVLAHNMARKKNRSGLGWAFIAFQLPVVAHIILACLPVHVLPKEQVCEGKHTPGEYCPGCGRIW